jgi:hypothetical protein
MREIHLLPSKPEECMWCFTSEHTSPFPNRHLMSWCLGTNNSYFSRIQRYAFCRCFRQRSSYAVTFAFLSTEHTLTRSVSNQIYVRCPIIQRNKQNMTSVLWSALWISRMANSHTQRKIYKLRGFSRHVSFHASPAIWYSRQTLMQHSVWKLVPAFLRQMSHEPKKQFRNKHLMQAKRKTDCYN